MVLKFYCDLLSQPTRTIWMFLKANNIPFKECPVELGKGEHKTEAFAKVNPFQKVPAIDHNGFILPESLAIIRYLIRENSVADHWYPKNSKARAKVDMYLSWHPLAVRASAGGYFVNKFFVPFLTGQPANEEKCKEMSENLEKALDELESVYLKDTPFLCGKEISIADLFAITELEQDIAIGYDIKKNRKVLTAWMNRVKAKIGPHYTEAHKKLATLKA